MKEMTVIEAARKFGFHPTYLGVLLRMGFIDGHKDPDGHWHVKTASIDAYRKKTGRGRKAVKQGASSKATAGSENAPVQVL
jgi:hypothetical protein